MEDAEEVAALKEVTSARPFPLAFGTSCSWTPGVGTARGGPGMSAGTGLAGITSPRPCDSILHVAEP